MSLLFIIVCIFSRAKAAFPCHLLSMCPVPSTVIENGNEMVMEIPCPVLRHEINSHNEQDKHFDRESTHHR